MRALFFSVLVVVVSKCTHDICEYPITTISVEDCTAMAAQAHNAWNIPISTSPSWSSWDERLHTEFGEVFKTYHAPYETAIPIEKDSGYSLFRRVPANGTMHVHTDPPQHLLGMVLFLDDEVLGGEWEWPRQNVTVKPERGKVTVFPNSHTHPKRIKAVRLGEMRFIVTRFSK